ncbi:hypothetical protein SAMN05880501_1182 [Ureibacillus xyleni]|uniref:Uncharacterized protein n=1 Tax=Ureibacillus xyleni TaxID=614648 RepID=A0A285TPV5_9BACL|nr:hypothetical protein [Ureibacillus xyleni]SOC24999.1 hypothetical protein SAMN05880501_1182 [Ureibacillus xyleni]
MRWQEVQKRFPNEWVVLEVIVAHSDDGYRYIDEVVVVDKFENSLDAMERYEKLRKGQPQREYCFFHTSRQELVARERYMGIRGPR